MKLTKRKGFNFFRSYYDVYNELENDADKVAFIDALLDRQFLGLKPLGLTGMAKFAYISQTNSIDSQVKGYEDKTGTKLGQNPKEEVNTPPTEPPTEGGCRTPTEQVEEKGKEKGEYTLYSDSEFLEDWAKCRLHYLKKPTNIGTLNTYEKDLFNRYVLSKPPKDFKDGMQGLMFQEVINFSTMTLRPKHFLENIDIYIDAWRTKDTKLYGSKKVEE